MLDEPAPAAPRTIPAPPRTAACPTCEYRPTDARELELHRDSLTTIWLTLAPDQPEQIVERRYCERCQPHQARIVMCGLLDTTVMLGSDLAVAEPSPLPQPAAQWFTAHRWRQQRGHWYCGNHSHGRS